MPLAPSEAKVKLAESIPARPRLLVVFNSSNDNVRGATAILDRSLTDPKICAPRTHSTRERFPVFWHVTTVSEIFGKHKPRYACITLIVMCR
ncbi:Uncharacterised protein [Mycobacteroides abscessus subsp. abscessus]|nr:Uncharacterised protein [Mycobacteroides abscessus subsp. abscessus]